MQTVIKILLAVLFVVCLFNLPYGYYQFVRFAAMIGFSLLAYFSFEHKRNAEVIIYIGLALLFQPFIKVVLGRTIWNFVDVLVAAGLVGSLFFKNERKE